MLALYQQLFTGLLESQVEYCVWKNAQETPDALEGTGDIDLYIFPGSHFRFATLLRMHGFARLISHKSTPCVEHYYGYDAASGKFCHLHCYFRIVTGESHIKQYVVPIEDYLSFYPNTKNRNGVCEMHPMLQYKLNLFRRAIKLSCLPGALLFFRERRGYQHERILLEQALLACPETDCQTRDTGWLARIQTSSSLTGEVLAGLRYRLYFRHWNRFPALVTPFYRYGTILQRLAGKLRRRRKMLPVGITIAVAGASADDARMLESRIASWLGAHFDVVTVNDSVRLFRAESVQHDIAGFADDRSLRCAIGLLWRSINWRRAINSALRHTMAGSIVIWRGQDQESMRLAVATPLRRKNAHSAMTMSLLRAADTLMSAKPRIDILLRRSARSSAPGTYPMLMTVDECNGTHEDLWKHEMWQALVALQP